MNSKPEAWPENFVEMYMKQAFPRSAKLMYTDLFRDEVPQEHEDRLEMAAELLRRSRILVVCGDFMDEQIKEDVALAKRLRIPATTLDGIMEVEGSTGKRL